MTFDFKNSCMDMKGIKTNWVSFGVILTGALLRDKACHSITAKATLSSILNVRRGEFEGIEEILLPLL